MNCTIFWDWHVFCICIHCRFVLFRPISFMENLSQYRIITMLFVWGWYEHLIWLLVSVFGLSNLTLVSSIPFLLSLSLSYLSHLNSPTKSAADHHHCLVPTTTDSECYQLACAPWSRSLDWVEWSYGWWMGVVFVLILDTWGLVNDSF